MDESQLWERAPNAVIFFDHAPAEGVLSFRKARVSLLFLAHLDELIHQLLVVQELPPCRAN